MIARDEFRRLVADALVVPIESLTPEFAISRRNSIERAKLAALLERRLGRKVQLARTAETLGVLESAIFGGGGNEQDQASLRASPLLPLQENRTIRCGIDLERVDKFLAPDDYWQDPFYRESFSSSEIAYCMTRESPGQHFAARWCAKEALRKCDARFHKVPFHTVEIALNKDSSPYLRLVAAESESRLDYGVSITHTDELAGAIVILGGPAPQLDIASMLADGGAPPDQQAKTAQTQ